MSRFVMAVFAMAVFGIGPNWAAAEVEAPPKELVQYVREAKRQGLKDVAIRQSAVAIGWPDAVVDEAILSATDRVAKGALPATVPVTVPAKPAADPPVTPEAAPEHISGTPDATKNRGVPDDYKIGAGDVLQISVWKEPEASVPNAVVRPDGRISIPLLKEVEVMGLTPRQAEKVITDGLSKLINAVDTTVIVTTITSKKIYVVGAAKKEGPLPYTYRMTIMQAISEAGGLTDYAKRKKIYVLHTDNGKEYRLPFNYDEVLKGEKMEQNIQLSAGDTLLIPH